MMLPTLLLLLSLFAAPAPAGALPGVASAPGSSIQEPEKEQEPEAEKEKEKEGKKQRAARQSFLLFGTVFTEQGFLVRGAEIAVRREGEKRVRWRGRTDRRGEFAVRVPAGAEYVMEISARGLEPHEEKVDARQGYRTDLLIRLKPAEGGPK